MNNNPGEDTRDLMRALRDKFLSILNQNPYYVMRKDVLRRQIDLVQRNASGSESWDSVRSLYVVLALVAYYDSARGELPPQQDAETHGSQMEQVAALVLQTRQSIPITDVANLVVAFNAIESLAVVERTIAGTDPPRVMTMLSPYLIIRNLQDFSQYYATTLPATTAALTHGALAPFWRATRAELLAYIGWYSAGANYMNTPPGGWVGIIPNPFDRFMGVIAPQGMKILEDVLMRQGMFEAVIPTEYIILELENRLALTLLLGFIHKNRDAFLAAIQILPINELPAAAEQCTA